MSDKIYICYDENSGEITGSYPGDTDTSDIAGPYAEIDISLYNEVMVEGKIFYADGNFYTEYKPLTLLKEEKKEELKLAYVRYMNLPIVINQGIEKIFFGGPKAYDKYKKAYELGVEQGLTEGSVILLKDGVPQWEPVNANEMTEYLTRAKAQEYKAERKLGYYLYAVAASKDESELNLIKWEDKRT